MMKQRSPLSLRFRVDQEDYIEELRRGASDFLGRAVTKTFIIKKMMEIGKSNFLHDFQIPDRDIKFIDFST